MGSQQHRHLKQINQKRKAMNRIAARTAGLNREIAALYDIFWLIEAEITEGTICEEKIKAAVQLSLIGLRLGNMMLIHCKLTGKIDDLPLFMNQGHAMIESWGEPEDW